VSIRQPDSKVLKGEFEADKALADVRVWIDQNRTDGSNAPYVLQTTFPTRTFEVSEEHQETLGSIFGKGGQCIMKVSATRISVSDSRKLRRIQKRILPVRQESSALPPHF
jgi:hypothetical protein